MVKTSTSFETGGSLASRYFFAVSRASLGRPAPASASIAATAAIPAATVPLSELAKALAASRFAPVAALAPSSERRRTAAARPAEVEEESLAREASSAFAAAVRSATSLKTRAPDAGTASDARGASKRARAEENRAARRLLRRTIPPQTAPIARMAPPATRDQRAVSDLCVDTKSRASVRACSSWSVFICFFVSRLDMSVWRLASAESGERRILVIEEKSPGLLLGVVVVHPDHEPSARNASRARDLDGRLRHREGDRGISPRSRGCGVRRFLLRRASKPTCPTDSRNSR